jgi:hypothetical protein
LYLRVTKAYNSLANQRNNVRDISDVNSEHQSTAQRSISQLIAYINLAIGPEIPEGCESHLRAVADSD